jgi:hypothetical protein
MKSQKNTDYSIQILANNHAVSASTVETGSIRKELIRVDPGGAGK